MSQAQIPKTLVVATPGLQECMPEWKRLEGWVKQTYPDCDFFYYRWSPFAGRFKGSRLADISRDLSKTIENLAKDYQRLILVGHSFGGVIAREAYVLAGAQEKSERPSWIGKVSRILMFAAPNRGFRPYARHTFALTMGFLKLIAFQWVLLEPPKWFPLSWLLDLEKGSFFITNLRLAWVTYIRDHENPPVLVQFLGDVDDIVAREDIRDAEGLPNSHTVEIKHANHRDLFDPDGPLAHADNAAQRALLIEVFGAADPFQSKLASKMAVVPRIKYDIVVFILHGIRDSNAGWVTDIYEEVERQGQALPQSVAIDRSTYGWFSAIKFALPWIRRRNIPWFLDLYSDYFTRNPKTSFRFVGHSNGTYILGMSLRHVPAMTFDRVFMAGSVLPRDYQWQVPTRVKSVVNHCSSEDVPVGCLCRLLNTVSPMDLGTGGFDGFSKLHPNVQQLWFKGGHGKPLERKYHRAIVDYILGNTPGGPPIPPKPDDFTTDTGTTRAFQIAKRLLSAPVALFVLLSLLAAATVLWAGGHPGAVVLGFVLLYAVLNTI